jgi:hypothetical protein
MTCFFANASDSNRNTGLISLARSQFSYVQELQTDRSKVSVIPVNQTVLGFI